MEQALHIINCIHIYVYNCKKCEITHYTPWSGYLAQLYYILGSIVLYTVMKYPGKEKMWSNWSESLEEKSKNDKTLRKMDLK